MSYLKKKLRQYAALSKIRGSQAEVDCAFYQISTAVHLNFFAECLSLLEF
ncbi:MAG: hypothetical protein HHJ16_12660 [Polaromonas sp.]|nr:hypothetical protein [Polaromonas sp.]NMM11106.1 hypothetical protein [Polaromonas sp.]